MKKTIYKIGTLIITAIIMILVTLFYSPYKGKNIEVSMDIDSHTNEVFQMYYLIKDEDFSESQVSNVQLTKGNNHIIFSIPNNASKIRLDFGNTVGEKTVNNIKVSYNQQELSKLNLSKPLDKVGFDKVIIDNQIIKTKVNSEDSYIIWDISSWNIPSLISSSLKKINIIYKMTLDFIIFCVGIFVFKKFDFFTQFPYEIISNKKLALNLSKNDFKTKFAGSYLGIVWAFIQPIVTVAVYWFVFQVGLRNGGVGDVPFVLWLIAGLVPWFFFSDALNGGTSALLDYQYLVKKVVFQIDILPFVKVMSALFIHFFFVCFTLVLYACYGYFPDLYTLQVIYYTLALFVFVLGLCYVTSAIVVFFRDLTQIINIILQIGVWMTPIMWNIDTMQIPSWLKNVFKFNPLYYITAGYRDALINKVWFYQRTGLTLYFWIITILLFGFGTFIFKRLKVHFADVL